MRLALLLLALVACEKTRTVEVQLGPNSKSVTLGFRCNAEASPNAPLFDRAVTGSTVHLTIVVDLVDLGGVFPGCRGEELVASCNAHGPCRILPGDNGIRYCREVTFDTSVISDPNDLSALLATIRSKLGSPIVTHDAPSQPVLIRAVATAQPCDDVLANGFAAADLVGCAYSCPVQLDSIDGPIALSLDALDNDCERQVRACALFQ